jgi:putative peptidoglycan lipid II flippase
MSLYTSAVGVVVARALGLGAAVGFTVFLAHRFGSDRLTDLAFTALIIPNALMVVIANYFPPVFVSVFKAIDVQRGSPEAWVFGRSAPRAVALLAAAATAAGVLASPALAPMVATGFSAEEVRHVTRLMQVAFPLIFFTAVAAAVKGLLNANGSFFVPSLDTLVTNAVAIVVIAASADRWGVFSIVAGVAAGGAGKLLLMVPGYWARRPPGPAVWFHPSVREAGRLLVPVLLNSLVFTLNVAVVRALATRIPMEGAVSHLSYAERIFSAPQDLLVVSMGVVLLPSMTASAASRDFVDLRRRVTLGLRLALFFGIPAAAGLALVAEPLVRLFCERGRFDAADTVETARALRGYAPALAVSGHLILHQAFYAMRQTRSLLVVGLVTLAVSAGLGMVLVGPLRQVGLALAFSASILVGAVLALAIFIRSAGAPDLKVLGGTALRVGACAGGMAGVVWGLQRWGGAPVLGVIAAGVAVFALLARLLCSGEWKLALPGPSRADT